MKRTSQLKEFDEHETEHRGEKLAWSLGFFICCTIGIALVTRSKVPIENEEVTPVLDLKEWLQMGRSSHGGPIIFVESALRSTLTIRQSCSVESAAKWNPNMDVLLVMTSPPRMDDPLVRLMRGLYGAHIVYTNPEEVFSGTPLESWYESGIWNHTDFKIVHLSDAMRLALLWRLGGIYLDLDIVVQRPLGVLRNAIVTEAEDYLCNAVMAFEPGHGFVTQCLQDFASNYSGATWIANGPVLVTRVVHSYCGVNHTEMVKNTDCDMNILPASVGYSLIWQKWQWFFQPERTQEVLDLYNSSLLVHMWNSQSYRGQGKVGSGSAIDVLFSKNCPASYRQAVGGIF